jgi:hypothetical protein
MNVEEKQPFDSWCLVEVFGHQKIAGRVTEETVGAAAMIRVDVPETGGGPAYTKYFGNAAIYSMTPTTEEIARAAAAQIERYNQPVPYAPVPAAQKQLPAPATVPPDDEDEDWPVNLDDDEDER